MGQPDRTLSIREQFIIDATAKASAGATMEAFDRKYPEGVGSTEISWRAFWFNVGTGTAKMVAMALLFLLLLGALAYLRGEALPSLTSSAPALRQ